MDVTYLICHRRPERSFHIKGHQFPVCARCTGFYISVILYCIYAFFNYIDYSMQFLIFAVLLLIPAAIDGFTQYFELRESNNTLRLITGLCGGLGLIILIKAFKFYFL
ncbi:DUF2085 domain-containing protein [Methanobrevibacter thaueri]|uniref:DUF2085 domain-containing protein n=1 Tax=Methanobrevibacter thaueri TaxID=190975 RepID=UPI000E301806|nr:DUF2085 domain-containing protein [Methanobrevibacter thaueri]